MQLTTGFETYVLGSPQSFGAYNALSPPGDFKPANCGQLTSPGWADPGPMQEVG